MSNGKSETTEPKRGRDGGLVDGSLEIRMSQNNTTRLVSHIHQTWLDGYQRAVEAMRSWADEFADEQSKAAVLACADMVEAAAPTKEMLGGKSA